jgi:hypothetical protein
MFTPFAFRTIKEELVPVGPAYAIRTDAYSSSVKLAVPGTYFGSTFGQTTYYSDISSAIRGTGSDISMVATGSVFATGSVVSSGSFDFATNGYTGSIYAEDNDSIGYASSTELPFSNNSYVVEAWVRLDERLYSPGAPFHKSIARGVPQTWGADISFLSQNSPNYRMRTILADVQYFTGTVIAALGGWYHYAWVRSVNNLYFYQNGVRIHTASSSATQSAIPIRILGGILDGNDGAKGAVQDIRITIGSDRGYNTATITPPDSIVIEN